MEMIPSDTTCEQEPVTTWPQEFSLVTRIRGILNGVKQVLVIGGLLAIRSGGCDVPRLSWLPHDGNRNRHILRVFCLSDFLLVPLLCQVGMNQDHPSGYSVSHLDVVLVDCHIHKLTDDLRKEPFLHDDLRVAAHQWHLSIRCTQGC